MAVTFYLGISFMMSEAKVPDFDTNGLFRALHSHNPPNYSQSSLGNSINN